VRGQGGQTRELTPDGTLGGYIAKHGRPPAFEGSDDSHYSVDLYLTERTDDGDLNHRFGGALLFVRWSKDGTQPVGHLETPYLCQADDRHDVRSHLHSLSLHEVKEHLDLLVDKHRSLPDW